jgi:predicted  nucleic acid-binding Zn ribbon protein
MANTGCLCKEWEENIDKALGPAVFYYQRFGTNYDGVKFRYCPWCASELNFEREKTDVDAAN